jgi:cytochrome c oxidase assembly protein subunit 15
MDGALVPPGLLADQPVWRNVFENIATVQFDHRLVAYVLLVAAIGHAIQARGTAFAGGAAGLAAVVAAQAALGIATLLMVVPLHLALTHQLGAIAVLTVAVLHLRAMTMAGREAPSAAAAPTGTTAAASARSSRQTRTSG